MEHLQNLRIGVMILLIVFVMVIGCSAASPPAMFRANSPELAPLRDKDAVDLTKPLAQDGVKKYVPAAAHPPPGGAPLQLGNPLPLIELGTSDITNPPPGAAPSAAFTRKPDSMLFPVFSDDDVKGFVTVDKSNGEWSPSGYAKFTADPSALKTTFQALSKQAMSERVGAMLRSEAPPAADTPPAHFYIIQIRGPNISFVAETIGDTTKLIPLRNAPELDFIKGQAEPLDQAITKLQKAAAAVDTTVTNPKPGS